MELTYTSSSGPLAEPSGESAKLYSVSQLARDLGVTARTIRFYEDKDLISPLRAGNNRVYTLRDRARMILILRGKKLGFTLREIKEYLDLYDVDPTQSKQLRLLLKAVHDRIVQLEDQRVALDEALGELRDVEAQTHNALEALGNAVRRQAK
jgi:DNA-binding transcriptional MerR regulator